MSDSPKIKIVWQTRRNTKKALPVPNPALLVLGLALSVMVLNLYFFKRDRPLADNSYAAQWLAANPSANPQLAQKLKEQNFAYGRARTESEPGNGGGKIAGAFISTVQAKTVDLEDQEKDEKKPFEYEVEGGDTLSSIAKKYNLDLKTILWANDLSEKSVIRPGQKITLLPVDGVLHKVEKGDTISKIALLYKGDSQKIAEYNGIEDATKIHAGDMIIIPGGKEPPALPKKAIPKGSGSQEGGNPLAGIASGISKLVWPTTTKNLTQGYSTAHRGLDIANGGTPPIIASHSGTVEFAGKSGDWGNTIVIRGDDGLATRYSHNSENYVSTGEKVEAGATIGKVGNTGNVKGKTGLHVDFRVYKNGVAVNPLSLLK